MELIIASYILGCLSAISSIAFRLAEIKNKTLYIGKNAAVSALIFIVSYFILAYFFSNYQLMLPGTKALVSWSRVYLIVYFVSHYQLKIIFEMTAGKSFYPDEDEIKNFIEKNNK